MDLGLDGKVALDACGRALDQVLAVLDAGGVEPARRTTSGLELHVDWESRQPGRGPVAYLASARLTVRLAQPALAGQVAAATTLGPVLQINEAPPQPPDARPMRMMAAEAAPTAPSTEPGETTVRAAVTVTWSLHPR